MRVVLDTTVVVAAVRSSGGASRQLLLAGLERRVVMIASVALMLEYEAVLKRTEHLDAAGITANEVDAVLDAISSTCEAVHLPFWWRPQMRDPNDEMVLETAIHGRADRLVTFNLKHFRPAAADYALQVSGPADVWHEISRGSHEKK